MPWVAGRWLRGGGGTMADRQGLVRGRMQVMVPCRDAVLHGGRLAALLEGRRGGLHAIPSLRRHDPDQVPRDLPNVLRRQVHHERVQWIPRGLSDGRLSVRGWQGTAGSDALSCRTPPGTDVIIGMVVAQERPGIMVIPNAAQPSSTIRSLMLRRRAYAEALAYPRRMRMVGYSPAMPSVCAMRSASSGVSLGWLA